MFVCLFWLHWVLVAGFRIFAVACGILCCGMRDPLLQHAGSLVVACMQDLAPRPGIEPGPPALGVCSLNHWTTREVPPHCGFDSHFPNGVEHSFICFCIPFLYIFYIWYMYTICISSLEKCLFKSFTH